MSARPSAHRRAATARCERCGWHALTEVLLQTGNSVALVCPNCGRQSIRPEGDIDRRGPGQHASTLFYNHDLHNQ